MTQHSSENHLRLAVTIAILLLLALPAVACLWDHDTLRTEAKGLPGLAEIITGRFERNPPLYYEMRLERSAKAIELNTSDWDAYDNAGVACDRLGRSDEAIQWMDRKKQAMDAAHIDEASLAEHRYRYLANLGTFHAHRWFSNGANREDWSDMERGAELIAAAIDKNPNAHFGRERYQLLAMQWILNPPEGRIGTDGTMSELPTLFFADEGFRTLVNERGQRSKGNLRDAGLTDAINGLAGLIALGNAWESVDVFFALGTALNDNMDSAMAYLAKLRCHELIRNGKKSLHPAAPSGDELLGLIETIGYMTTEEGDIDAYFQKARMAADAWHEARTKFMLSRLELGLHPDTDASFWDGYDDGAPSKLPNGILGYGREQASTLGLLVLFAATSVVILVGAIHLFRRAQRIRSQIPADTS